MKTPVPACLRAGQAVDNATRAMPLTTLLRRTTAPNGARGQSAVHSFWVKPRRGARRRPPGCRVRAMRARNSSAATLVNGHVVAWATRSSTTRQATTTRLFPELHHFILQPAVGAHQQSELSPRSRDAYDPHQRGVLRTWIRTCCFFWGLAAKLCSTASGAVMPATPDCEPHRLRLLMAAGVMPA